jgi:hypothetical protein
LVVRRTVARRGFMGGELIAVPRDKREKYFRVTPPFYWFSEARYRSASMAAAQPMPAAVIACR